MEHEVKELSFIFRPVLMVFESTWKFKQHGPTSEHYKAQVAGSGGLAKNLDSLERRHITLRKVLFYFL